MAYTKVRSYSKESDEYYAKLRSEGDELFRGMSNDELYDYAADVENKQEYREEAIRRTETGSDFDFAKAFASMKTNGGNYNVLVFLGQIEHEATQEQLGEVAKWLIDQGTTIHPFTVMQFCKYIKDENVIKSVKDYVNDGRELYNKEEALIGLDSTKKYDKKHGFVERI